MIFISHFINMNTNINMYLNRLLFIVLFFLNIINTAAQSRKVISIPNILGYQTMKCDFHTHTVFSDGTVWPTVRVEEAWREGLDALSITDHIEYLPHSKDISADHNRSFEIAEQLSKELSIILVKGAEITRNMPPGHLNALFIKNANLLDREDVFDAIREARDQGAFLMWNHPCWKDQQPDSTAWWDEHTRLYDNDLMHGIEVFNESFCTEALTWSIEKDLTIFANTDVHGPIVIAEGHRPMTLVFAKSRTLGGIKEALFSQRTVAYFGNMLVGNASFLDPLFFASLEIDKTQLRLENEKSKTVNIRNNSDIDYELLLVQPGIGFDAPETVILKAHHITPIQLLGNSSEVGRSKTLSLYYEVTNMKTAPDKNLIVTFSFPNF